MEIRGLSLDEVYSENVVAKVLQVAQRGLKFDAPLQTYPESVPQNGDLAGKYEERDKDFWTLGFFPGSIYALVERTIKFPQALKARASVRPQLHDYLLKLGRHWSVAINNMSNRTDTHDMGFIVQPALQKDWELTGNVESLHSVINAAYALASRYDHKVKAIRSWDTAINDRYSIVDAQTNFLVIIDSMCNLDLLYYVGHHQNDQSLIDIATTHADTIRAAILRPDYSSYHLVNFDPLTGLPKAKMTNQGHHDESTWSRGQAWAIMGFAQTYNWTKEFKYLQTSIKCAKYFLARLDESNRRHHHHLVPVWDFDAPQQDPAEPLRDVSAGVIAANGLLLIHQSLQSLSTSTTQQLLPEGGGDFLDQALKIIDQTLDLALDRDFASFESGKQDSVNGIGTASVTSTKDIQVKTSSFDAILRHSTANNNEHAHKRYWNHGLVYADYYLLEFGNKLLRAGIV